MEPPSLPPVLTPPKRSGLAVASMILGIAGVLPCFGPLTGIPAVICGHLARAQIRKPGGQSAGSGLTIAGLVTGYFSLVWILVFAVIAVAAISNSQKPQPASPARAGCVANLKTIGFAAIEDQVVS